MKCSAPLLVLAAACGTPETPPDADASLYALVQGIDGVYFYPPLGPEPSPTGTFDANLLDGVAVTLESVSAAGDVTALATFDQTTQPAVALLASQERYWVNIPAATYLTDPSKTYRVRVLLDGSELGTSVLGAHVFTVLSYHPSLPIGVHVRIEGTDVVRAVSRQRQVVTGTPRHCTDGVRNKDETGVDCGGSCRPCCIPSPEVCDGLDNNCDGRIDEGNPGGGVGCTSTMGGSCGPGTLQCVNGALVCQSTSCRTPASWKDSSMMSSCPVFGSYAEANTIASCEMQRTGPCSHGIAGPQYHCTSTGATGPWALQYAVNGYAGTYVLVPICPAGGNAVAVTGAPPATRYWCP